MDWKLDQLKQELKSNPEVKGWIITQENIHRKERYFLNDENKLGIDQDRDTRLQSIQLRLFVDRGIRNRQGELTVKLFQNLDLRKQIQSAIAAAKLTDHQAWDLPKEIPLNIPELKTTDPAIHEDIDGTLNQLTLKIRNAVEKKRNTVFNSAELFLSLHEREFHLSNGLVHRASQSRIYTEAAYSKAIQMPDGKTQADEYLNTQWAVSLKDLDVQELFDETSDLAEASLNTQKPMTGKYPVIVNAEVLSTLWNNQISHLTATHAYNQMPFQKPGTEFIPGAVGEKISLSLDPSLDYAADTAALSSQGILQKPLWLVKDNMVVGTIADLQHATYLGLSATTTHGAVVMNPGILSYKEMTGLYPVVIEILQFSGLFADVQSGTFSSEIRLARIFDQKTKSVRYIKGGSLSGSITENFQNARFSKELAHHSSFSADLGPGHGYRGPKFALLNDVSIVG